MSEYIEPTPLEQETNPDMLFRDLDGNTLDVTSVNLTDGTIQSVEVDEELLPSEEVQFEKYLLEIPGLGWVAPGTRIIYKENDYVLNFGWHINSSNQNIYSWYLESLDVACRPKTVYKEMINEFNLIHFR